VHDVVIHVAPWAYERRVKWDEALIHVVEHVTVGGHEFGLARQPQRIGLHGLDAHFRIRMDVFLTAHFDGLDPEELGQWATARDPDEYLEETDIEAGRLAIAVRTLSIVETAEGSA